MAMDFAVRRGKEGKYMCCLVFKQGLHTLDTCPLLIVLFRSKNIAKKHHADVQAYPVDEHTIAMLNAPNNALIGQFIHQHHMGPIIWEQTKYEKDVYYCENSIITTNIVGCGNNSSPITSTTSSEAAEEYLSKYMVKEKANLKQVVPSLLAALDQIIAHPSKAEDTGSTIQTGIHLAQHTVNTFTGSHQWSMPLMALALLGNKSTISSELFRYVFPHANVSYVNSLIEYDSNLCHGECAKRSHLTDENNEYAQSCLDAVMESV